MRVARKLFLFSMFIAFACLFCYKVPIVQALAWLYIAIIWCLNCIREYKILCGTFDPKN